MARLLAAPRRDTVGGLRDATLLEVLYGTGLRRHEVFALNRNDWQREQSGLWVADGKGNKSRLQPVGEQLSRLLETYLSEVRELLSRDQTELALWLGNDGKRLSYQCLGQCLQRYCQREKLPTISPHALRRAFATHLLLRGAELHEVQTLLGHANPQVTQRYTKIEVVDLLLEYRRTHPRANLRRLPGGPKPLVRKHKETMPGLVP